MMTTLSAPRSSGYPSQNKLHLALIGMSLAFMTLMITSSTQGWAERPMVLELNQLTVNETKPSGKRWDFGLGKISKPDLIIIVSLDDEQLLITKKCKDSFSCELARSAPFMLKGEQILKFKIIDKDLKRDDTIDLLTVRLNESEPNQRQDLKLAGKSTSMLSFTLRPFIEKTPVEPSSTQTQPEPAQEAPEAPTTPTTTTPTPATSVPSAESPAKE